MSILYAYFKQSMYEFIYKLNFKGLVIVRVIYNILLVKYSSMTCVKFVFQRLCAHNKHL